MTYAMTQYKDAADNLIDFQVGGVYNIRVRGVYADGTAGKYSNIVELTIDNSFQNSETENTETESSETEEIEPGMTEPAP